MKTFFRRMSSAALALLLIAPLMAGEYRVGAGDVLTIRVVGQRDMDGVYSVSPDGDIAFPMVGRVSVKEKSLSQVQDELTRGLQEGYVRHPAVSVSLERSNSRKFFVYGEVKTPGEYRLTEDGMTALRAVAMAGGLVKGASESKVRLLRPKADGGVYEVIQVDLKEVMDGKVADPSVGDRDIIIVREGWF
jgi:polysaccharide biosynthesis/export protein